METIINQILKILEDNNLSVEQSKCLLNITSDKLERNSVIKIKKTS